MSGKNKYSSSQITALIQQHPAATDSEIARMLTGGTESGSLRTRVARIRSALPVPKTGMTPTVTAVTHALEQMGAAMGGDVEITVDAGRVQWEQDESARWEKTEGRSSLFVRPREQVAGPSAEERIVGALEQFYATRRPAPLPHTPTDNGYTLVLIPADLHLGARAVDGNWSPRLAVDMALRHQAQIIARAAALTGGRFATMLVDGNDKFHTGNGYSTERGTQQLATALPGEEHGEATRHTLETIETCSAHGPVTYVGVTGNHGRSTEEIFLRGTGEMITRGFLGKGVTTVPVVPMGGPTFVLVGDTLHMFRHYDGRMSPAKANELANEILRHPLARQSVRFAVHGGHFHSWQRTDVAGVGINTYPTIKPQDHYHAAEGYGGQRRLMGILYGPNGFEMPILSDPEEGAA